MIPDTKPPIHLTPPRKLGRRLSRTVNVGSTAPKFSWRCPEGLCAKHILHRWALSLAGDESALAHTASWSALGVTAAGAFRIVSEYLPWFGEFFAEVMGRSLTGETLKDRLYNMYHDRKTGRMGVSGEHPLRSPTMSPFCSMAVIVFARRQPLTREQVAYLFSLSADGEDKRLAYWQAGSAG